jgi:hypothetical protein
VRGRWHDDPSADDIAANAFGGTDSVIDLSDPAPSNHAPG